MKPPSAAITTLSVAEAPALGTPGRRFYDPASPLRLPHLSSRFAHRVGHLLLAQLDAHHLLEDTRARLHLAVKPAVIRPIPPPAVRDQLHTTVVEESDRHIVQLGVGGPLDIGNLHATVEARHGIAA